VQGEQFSCTGAKPPIRAQQGKSKADPHGAQGRFLRACPARAKKGRVGGGPIGKERLGLIQMRALRIARAGLGERQQRTKAMRFPKAANIRAGAGQDIQRMGPGVKRPVPVQWRHGQCGGFGQKRAARYWLIRQGVTGDPSRKTQTMPDKKRDRPRAKAPSRIGV
jgi:hypothetical protein